ncbi:TPA: type VI secretion system ImpA family N-terminal domain-containing protein [Klebsiella michiganensis]|nr:type VI secretion system ImpA family N-terminal domain-containing protein [Klebsiella michiganensis]
MHDEQPCPVRTGGDPRSLPQFTALRDEMSNLTHPARPDVDWKRVETLSLSLFQINGVELQTGAWYTLARSHLARVSGLNEGLDILTALLGYQWAQLWPQPVHARAEILSGLFQRVQKLFRTWSLQPADVTALELAERHLQALDDILKRQELRHACHPAPLVQQIRSALNRLENSPLQEEAGQRIAFPEQRLLRGDEVAPPASRLVYVIHQNPDVEVQVTEALSVKPKRWPVFVAGMAASLVLSAAIASGWLVLHQPDDATKTLAASIASLPEPMTAPQIAAFRETGNGRKDSAKWLERITNQVNGIMNQSPGWRLRYGQGLVSQAKALWPDDPATRELVKRWEQYQGARSLPASQLQGWHEGMTQLRALSAKLDALDHQKGKYLTGSELKTMVWQITSSFASAVPVEEQLRQLVPPQENANASNAEQVSRHLDSLSHILEKVSNQGGDVHSETDPGTSDPGTFRR